MAFWSEARQLNTKRAYRWICLINNLDEWIVKSVTKPSFSISETSHRFINHTFWYPGRVEWSTISVVLVDPVTPDAGKSVLHMIEAAGYQIPDAPKDKWLTISKQNATAALKGVTIKQLDPEGNALEIWTLHNPWIKDVKFGDLSYDGDDILNISLTFRFDWANMETRERSYSNLFPSGLKGPAPSQQFPSSYKDVFK